MSMVLYYSFYFFLERWEFVQMFIAQVSSILSCPLISDAHFSIELLIISLFICKGSLHMLGGHLNLCSPSFLICGWEY